jgi:hypothetical protein
VTEAAAAALLLNQAVKLLAGRKRPYAFFDNDVGYSKSEDNLSFYGGHTSFGFTVVAATVTVASMRGYPGVGIAADQHYLTDILVGAAVGGLVGWAVPRVFHSPSPTSSSPSGLRIPPLSFTFAL